MIGDLFGTDQLFDTWDSLKLVSRLGVDVAFTWMIVGRIYGRLYPHNREFIFPGARANPVGARGERDPRTRALPLIAENSRDALL